MIDWSVLNDARPGDIVFFRGAEAVSNAISLLQRKQLGKGGDTPEWTHVGILVNSTLLPDRGLIHGQWYVYESTMSGILGDGVRYYHPRKRAGFFGVQLRPLVEIVERYEKKGLAARVGIARPYGVGCDRPWNLTDGSVRAKAQVFQEFFDATIWTRYDFNPLSLGAAIFPPLRPFRPIAEALMNSHKWLFCSELVAAWFVYLGVIDADEGSGGATRLVCRKGKHVHEFQIPKDVVPVDLLGWDEDGLPAVVYSPKVLYEGMCEDTPDPLECPTESETGSSTSTPEDPCDPPSPEDPPSIPDEPPSCPSDPRQSSKRSSKGSGFRSKAKSKIESIKDASE